MRWREEVGSGGEGREGGVRGIAVERGYVVERGGVERGDVKWWRGEGEITNTKNTGGGAVPVLQCKINTKNTRHFRRIVFPSTGIGTKEANGHTASSTETRGGARKGSQASGNQEP